MSKVVCAKKARCSVHSYPIVTGIIHNATYTTPPPPSMHGVLLPGHSIDHHLHRHLEAVTYRQENASINSKPRVHTSIDYQDTTKIVHSLNNHPTPLDVLSGLGAAINMTDPWRDTHLTPPCGKRSTWAQPAGT